MEGHCGSSAAVVSSVGHSEGGIVGCVPGEAGLQARSPRTVLRGVFAQHDVTESIDWFTGTGDNGRLQGLTELCAGWWGPFEVGRGCQFYRQSLRFGSGARIDWTDADPEESAAMNPGRFKLALSGSVLSVFDGADRLEALKEFRKVGGLRITRCDLAVDFKGDDVRVVDLMLESTERGKRELRGFQSVQPHVHHRSGKLTSLGVTLGRRGKNGSGRMVRAYDKGLESGDCPVNEYQRVEVEYTGDLARFVWASIAGNGESCDVQTITELVMSEADFRVPLAGGRRPRRVADLERVPWWQALLDAVGEVGKRIQAAKPRRATLDSFVRNFDRCYVRSMERVAYEVGCRIDDVLGLLMPNAVPRGGRLLLNRREFEMVKVLVGRQFGVD